MTRESNSGGDKPHKDITGEIEIDAEAIVEQAGDSNSPWTDDEQDILVVDDEPTAPEGVPRDGVFDGMNLEKGGAAGGAAVSVANAKKKKSSRLRPKKLGELLVQAGKLSEEHLQLALAVQKRTRERLGEVLHRGGYVRAEEVAKALALQYGLAYIEPAVLGSGAVDLDALGRLTIERARRFALLPINIGPAQYLVVSDILATKDSDAAMQLIGERRSLAVSTKAAILTAIEGMAYKAMDGDQLVDDAAKTIEGGEINQLLSYVLGRAVLAGASDIHIEPQGHSSIIRLRTDGVLRTELTLPRHRHENLVNVLFAKSGIDLSDFSRLHDGRFSFEFGARTLDVRFASSPTVQGPAVVMRILDDTRSMISLEELGYAEWNYKRITNLVKHPHGVVLIVGPTGSGKTTTLYSVLNMLNDGESKILTVEDPVEIKVASIQQVRVNLKAGVTFANSIRGFLRQDPDIILVGEIRDEETAREAFRAANTGHLVFSTLHANSAVESIGRLMDLGLDAYAIATALLGIISQRLMRTLCKECRVPLERRNRDRSLTDPEQELMAKVVQRPHKAGPGCSSCRNGYTGRAVVAEVLELDDHLRRLVHEKRPAIEVLAEARKGGFYTQVDNAAYFVRDGVTSHEEAERVVGPLDGVTIPPRTDAAEVEARKIKMPEAFPPADEEPA